MDYVARIVGIGITVSFIIGMLRMMHASFASQVSVAFTVVVLLVLIEPLRDLIQFFIELGRRAEIDNLYLDVILRAIGIAYITSIGSHIAKDAGEQAVGNMIELAGKILILTVGLPVFSNILLTLLRILPSMSY